MTAVKYQKKKTKNLIPTMMKSKKMTLYIEKMREIAISLKTPGMIAKKPKNQKKTMNLKVACIAECICKYQSII